MSLEKKEEEKFLSTLILLRWKCFECEIKFILVLLLGIFIWLCKLLYYISQIVGWNKSVDLGIIQPNDTRVDNRIPRKPLGIPYNYSTTKNMPLHWRRAYTLHLTYIPVYWWISLQLNSVLWRGPVEAMRKLLISSGKTLEISKIISWKTSYSQPLKIQTWKNLLLIHCPLNNLGVQV